MILSKTGSLSVSYTHQMCIRDRSMIPTYENMAKQAVVRVFNAIMTRAGITLIVTVAFSISSMFYNISTDYPFFMVAFLQRCV